MSSVETVKPAYELTEEGEVIQNKKGKAIVLGTFDRETGHLEFSSIHIDRYHREPMLRCISEDTEGIASGNKVKSFGIKGRPVDEPKEKEPEKPKASGLLGDKTPGVVDWYFKYRPQEAYVRYGVSLDKQDEPIVVHGRRVERRLGENVNTGLVESQEHVTENERGFLATRQTHRTFLKNEVVGAERDEVNAED